MNERIAGYVEYVHKYNNCPDPVIPEYDPADVLLPDVVMQSKRLAEYIAAQNIDVSRGQKLIGQMRFADDSYPSAFFPRAGHKRFRDVQKVYYCKPVDNLVTFEWQHSVLDYKSMNEKGLEEKLQKIEESRKIHREDTAGLEFLEGARLICEGILQFAAKCAKVCRKEAQKLEEAQYLEKARRADEIEPQEPNSRIEELRKLAQMFDWIPLHPARIPGRKALHRAPPLRRKRLRDSLQSQLEKGHRGSRPRQSGKGSHP